MWLDRSEESLTCDLETAEGREIVAMSGVQPRMDAVPAVGEHTDAILAALGRSEEEITVLRRAGAV